MSTTPEALRLADQAADMARMFTAPSHERGVLHGCAQELRRLAAVEAERDELRQLHERTIIEGGKKLGEDLSDEPRAKWLLLGVGRVVAERDQLRARLDRAISAAEAHFGEEAIRYKLSLFANGRARNVFPRSVDGHWVALQRADNDAHIGLSLRCLEAQAERDQLRAEVEALRGLKPEIPQRPAHNNDASYQHPALPRYGLRWNGPGQPVSVPMADGYWTPFHLALEALEG